MADAVDRAKDDGRVRLPRIDSAQNKLPPRLPSGGKGSKDDDKFMRLGVDDRQDSHAKILQRARKRFDRAMREESENRKNGLDDLKFKVGSGQWPADVAAQRNFDKRPCLTINKLPTFVNQVTNDARQNRPAIHFLPVGDKSDRRAAEMLDGMVRWIWRNSAADISLDTAFDSSASIGWGYMRVNTEYESPDSFNQDIVIKRVRNTFSVYLDPAHQEPDGSDAKWGFVSENWSRSDFEDEWPDADPMPWGSFGIGDTYKNWVTQETIRVVEYFEIKTEKRYLVQLSNGHVGWKDELAEETKALVAAGIYAILNAREADCPETRWYKLTAVDVLDEREWPGKWIPLPKVTGSEVDIEGKVNLSGVIRNAKAPQLMYNYMRTAEVELVGSAPKAKYLIAEGQDEGYEDEWRNSNTKNTATLHYRQKDLTGQPAPPPIPVTPTPVPQGVIEQVRQAAEDMQAVTGIRFDATRQERMYDESGRALRELRRSGDLSVFHYTDNLMHTLRHLGNIILDLIPKVYDTRRVITILREDDKEQAAIIDPRSPKSYVEERDDVTGKMLPVFNPTIGRYGVIATVGPSYATKRVEASESMMDFVRAIAPAAPNVATAIVDLIAKNQDWPGSAEFGTRLAKLVEQMHPGITQPDMKDVPPQVQAKLQAMDQQVKQLMQERIALMKQLTDQQADRAVKQDKIDKDFEAKLLAIVQKEQAELQKNIGTQLQGLAEGVATLRDSLTGGGLNGSI